MTAVTQAFRFAVVGVVSNFVLYLVYLGLTSAGIGHKSAMTGLYMLGATQTFLFNKRWSFGHDGCHGRAFVRYVTAYAAGYLLNLLVLMLAVDRLGLPHQVVQGLMIIVMAALFFLAQKYWVFADGGAGHRTAS